MVGMNEEEKKQGWLSRLINRVMGNEISRRVELAVRALDDARDRLLSSDTYPRDRQEYDRLEVLEDALEAWRVNPLARRIVELTSQYVVGGGISVECDHEATHRFINEWWNHRLNNMPVRVFEWCDELSRSGELFIIVSTDQAGMSYLRALPAAQVQEIITTGNDIEQETEIVERPSSSAPATSILEGKRWQVYNESEDSRGEDGRYQTVIAHYAVNRPVGAKHGESDLAPLLRWLSRYASWLEDRARLNRFRNTFIFWVKAKFLGPEDRLRRQAELNANPPNPGSLLVTDDTEEWDVLSPKLESQEAGEDGLALKKMISAGSGIPLHFIAEPESATRTTAESAGGPTFRHYQQRQLYFLWMIRDLAEICIRRRKMVDRMVNPGSELKISGSDISARDNASLATAAITICNTFMELRRQGWVDDAELLRIVYKFAGEMVDVEDMLRRGKRAGALAPAGGNNPAQGAAAPGAAPAKPGSQEAGRPQGKVEIDPISGEPKGLDE